MKNKKTILIIFLALFTIIVIVWLYIYKEKQDNKKEKIIIDNTKIENKDKDNNQDEIKEEIEKKDSNISTLKKKVASKWLIISWDIHLENDDYLFALQKYIKANKETPGNPKILAKIAETYFLMKNYKLAYNYYSRIEDKNSLDKERKTLSLLYSQNLEKDDFIKNSSWSLDNKKIIEKIDTIKSKIKDFNLEKDDEFYYINSLNCLSNFHDCKLNFQNYFKNENYSWKSQKLENIRTAIDNYENLKINELYYKNALIIWSFLQDKLYPITIILSKELLEEKENYKPIIKIISQSYFELNDLEESNKYLLEHARLDWKSSDISYMIWVVEQKNHDYIKSNIFLNLALEQWYSDKESIYRLQLYNYLILDKKEKIIEVFNKIIEWNQKPSFNDLMLATFYNIINDNLWNAEDFADKWLVLYPDNEDFYWLKAWILIEENKLDEAKNFLDKAKEIEPRNALIALNLWRIEKIKYEKENKIFNKTKAKLLFNKVVELDSWEVWELAQKYLKEIEENESSEN